MRVRYSENQINEINRLIANSTLNQSQIAAAVNEKFKTAPDKVKPDTVTHYARKYFKVPRGGALNKAGKGQTRGTRSFSNLTTAKKKEFNKKLREITGAAVTSKEMKAELRNFMKGL